MAHRSPRPLLVRISVVARRYGIHPQTLRLYERHGLLTPSRSRGNTRLYGPTDLERLEVILTLTRDLGVNLAGVEVILHMRQRLAALHQEMARRTANPGPLADRRETGTGEALVPVGLRALLPSSRRPPSAS